MKIDRNIGGGVDGTPGADLLQVEAQVAAAEPLGYDAVWTTEVGRDPFLPLTLAARTSRSLQLGTAVAIAFARNPMTVAVTANDLQAFSSGRFILGLGSQVKAHVTRRYGMPWSEPADRMREFLNALRAIWSCWEDGARLSFEGRVYRHTLMCWASSPRSGRRRKQERSSGSGSAGSSTGSRSRRRTRCLWTSAASSCTRRGS